jgi:hypothetical protein|tara:strand:- start:236 stop:664 length:429 start_codon:yes stop_codon:yes gene_type:complete
MHPTRIFKKPEEIEKAFLEYKQSLISESNKWLKVQYVGKDGARKTDAQKVPLTLEGFERFCYNNYGCVNHYFDNKEGYYSEFGIICTRIKREIREDQITGGLLGFYNPSITQRLNSLKETTSTEISGGLNIPNLPDIANRKK